MRSVETKEVIHALYIASREFRDVRDAGEYLATHFFNDDEDFTDDQVAKAMAFVQGIADKKNAEFESSAV